MEIAKGPEGAERNLILGLLDRWEADPDVETTWTTIIEASASYKTEAPPPSFFIAWVVRTRLEYEFAERVRRKSPTIEAKAKAQANRHWKANEVRDAAAKKLLQQEVSGLKHRVFGRQPKHALRNRFIRMLHDSFNENCGRPLIPTVATLTGIMFGGEVTEETVHTALRQRQRREVDTQKQK